MRPYKKNDFIFTRSKIQFSEPNCANSLQNDFVKINQKVWLSWCLFRYLLQISPKVCLKILKSGLWLGRQVLCGVWFDWESMGRKGPFSAPGQIGPIWAEDTNHHRPVARDLTFTLKLEGKNRSIIQHWILDKKETSPSEWPIPDGIPPRYRTGITGVPFWNFHILRLV